MYSPICIFFSLKRMILFAIPKTQCLSPPLAKREESKRWRISHTVTPSSRFIYQFPESLRLQGRRASFSSTHSILHSTRRHSSAGRGEAGLVCNDWVLEFVCAVTLMRWTSSSLAHAWSARSVESLPVSGVKGAGYVCLLTEYFLPECVIMLRCLFSSHRRECSTKMECKQAQLTIQLEVGDGWEDSSALHHGVLAADQQAGHVASVILVYSRQDSHQRSHTTPPRFVKTPSLIFLGVCCKGLSFSSKHPQRINIHMLIVRRLSPFQKPQLYFCQHRAPL